MAKRDYYPRAGSKRALFLDHFAAHLSEAARALGVPEAEAQAVVAGVARLTALKQARIDLHQQADAAAQAYLEQDQAMEQCVRALVQRLKAHPRYTSALGMELAVEGSPDQRTLVRQDAVAQQARPRLRLLRAQSGETLLAFNKGGFDGLELYCAQGNGPEPLFERVGRYTRSPALDPRANLAAGPEARRYRACYLRADRPAGQMSHTLHVTVQESIAKP